MLMFDDSYRFVCVCVSVRVCFLLYFGITISGQTIFQTHMRNSNFESLNESLLVGDDDLDIDGETSLNLDLTESLEIPTELTGRFKM